ncbi:lysozyme inhibitor LprI family protein [Burkholderia metallica]|uniref:lysozyme inhibitor LprI family protein n=1 Tax=Burkholderia metallica TaxID=488729 RepID=UPI0020C672A6|nr:hypothetical protein [Burkholderia metallica]
MEYIDTQELRTSFPIIEFDMKTMLILRMLVRTALLSASFWIASAAHAASFNCHLAKQPAEQTICAVPELSKLDDQLAIAWSLAPGRLAGGNSGLNFLKEYQRGWRLQRDACGKDVGCLRTSYLRRLQQLSQPAPDTVLDINDFHWSQTWTLIEIASKPLPHNLGGMIKISRNPYANAAQLTFNALSWNGENSGREYTADAVVRADGKAFHVGSDGCQLDFAIHGAQLEVEQRGQCGKVLGHGSDVDFQGTYIDEEHAPKRGFVFE